MNAHLTDQQLIDYQFDLAAEPAATEARTHLASCETCRRRLHDLARKLNALELLRDEVKAGPELLAGTIRYAIHTSRRRILFRRLSWCGAVAAVLVVGLTLLMPPGPRSPSTQSTASMPEQRPSEVALTMDMPEPERLVAAGTGDEGSGVKAEGLRGEGVPPLRPAGKMPAEKEQGQDALATEDKGKMPSLREDRRQAVLGDATRIAASATAIDEQPPFAPASAIELVVLPRRENVQLTIYNAADLTLVRERRNLTLKRGWNWLQFMWANTLIDPTSLSLEPLEHKDQVEVQQLVFPPRLRELGRWLIRSEVAGQVPFELTYFTSGLSWRAFYMGTLSQDEKTMRLEGYVRVQNNSGEDYEDAQTRLIVGQVHLLDAIADLAKSQFAYGIPMPLADSDSDAGTPEELVREFRRLLRGDPTAGIAYADEVVPRKEIQKEGLSEYFLYTIEGTETIPNEWGKRLLSLEADEIPVVSLCKYDEERWGTETIRFLSFANDKDHKLGETPLPDGTVRIYGRADEQGHLSYVGGMDVKYIPVGEEVELNLGPARLVEVKPVLMDYRTENHAFDSKGEVNGWEEMRSWKVEIANAGMLPVQVEVTRGFETAYWRLKQTGGGATYRKHDATHARFELTVPARQTQVFGYEVTTYHGVREPSFGNRELSDKD